MSILGKTAATVGVGAFALGLALLGATSAQAAEGTWQVIDVCGSQNDTVIVTGDYRMALAKPYGWSVWDGDPNIGGTVEIANADGLGGGVPFHPGGQLGDYGCPPQAPPETDPPAPAPSESPEQTVKAPVQQSSGTGGTSTPSVQAPDAGTTSTVPDATPEPTTTVDPTPSESPIAIAATDSTTSDDGGNLIIPIGGAVLIATALGGAAYAAGKLGLFKR